MSLSGGQRQRLAIARSVLPDSSVIVFDDSTAGGCGVGVGAGLVFTLTQVAIPLVLRYAIDDALVAGEAGIEVLHWIVAAFFAVAGLNYASNFTQELVVGRISGSPLFDLRRAMYRHLQHVSLSFMDKTEVGRLMSRLQGDVNALQEFLETSIFAIGDFVLLVVIVTVLLFLDLRLGLLTLSVVPVLIGVRIVWLPPARRAFLRAREASSVVNGALAESVHGVRTIQEMGREAVNFDLFDDKAKDNLRAHLRASKFSSVMIPIVDTLTGIAMAIVIVVGGGMVLGQELELGVMVAFIFYVQRFFDPIRSLTIQYSIMQRAMAAGQRIFEVLDVPIDVRDAPGAVPLPREARAIELDDVTFGYVPGRPVLRNVSFRVEPGETVALVGPTGSGKTSVTALVHRFYDVWSGVVRIGGHDVREVRQSDLGAHVAMVLNSSRDDANRTAGRPMHRDDACGRRCARMCAHAFPGTVPCAQRGTRPTGCGARFRMRNAATAGARDSRASPASRPGRAAAARGSRRARPPGLRPGRCGPRRGRCSATRCRASCARSARQRPPPSPSTRDRSGAPPEQWWWSSETSCASRRCWCGRRRRRPPRRARRDRAGAGPVRAGPRIRRAWR